MTFISVARAMLVTAEDTSVGDLSKYYQTGSDGPLSTGLLTMEAECDGLCVHDNIDAWLSHVPQDNEVIWRVSE